MKVALAAVLMLFWTARSAAAQSAAELVVSTVDQTGAPLAGVRLTIRGGADRTATTGAAGDYAFAGLSGGDYEVSAELSGFQREVRAVRVPAGERLTMSLTLRVGILEEAVVVTAAKAGERNVQTTPMAISAVSDAELERLGTRTLFQSAALAPSVTLSQNTNSAQLTIRGIGTNVVNAGSDPSSAQLAARAVDTELHCDTLSIVTNKLCVSRLCTVPKDGAKSEHPWS